MARRGRWRSGRGQYGSLKFASRLTTAGHVLQFHVSRCRNLPSVVLRGDRLLHLQQRPFQEGWPHEVPSDAFPPRRLALRDPVQHHQKIKIAMVEGARAAVPPSASVPPSLSSLRTRRALLSVDQRPWPIAANAALGREMGRRVSMVFDCVSLSGCQGESAADPSYCLFALRAGQTCVNDGIPAV